jgi:hypothetical protein
LIISNIEEIILKNTNCILKLKVSINSFFIRLYCLIYRLYSKDGMY